MRLALISLLIWPLIVVCRAPNTDDDDDDWANDHTIVDDWVSNSDSTPGNSGGTGSANNDEDPPDERGGGGDGPESTDTGEADEEPLTISGYNGIYNVETTDISGCDGERFWLREWGNGMMTISGDSDAANFDFGEGMRFGGSIGATQLYHFLGDSLFSTTVPGDTGSTERMARLDVENSGTFSLESDCWVMSGSFIVLVDEDDDGLDFNNCTMGAIMNARQISGGLCDAAK